MAEPSANGSKLESIDTHAARTPDRPATVLASTGETVSFADLNERSRRLARFLGRRGMGLGDHLAVVMDNQLRYLEVVWAAQRSGLFCTPVNCHLTAGESRYIIEDCGAQAVVCTPQLAHLVAPATLVDPAVRLVTTDRPPAGSESYEAALAASGEAPPGDEREGILMFYSSGTTGRPKGITRQLPAHPFGTPNGLDALVGGPFGFDTETIYLCPAPLYHAAPLGWSMATQKVGGTVVVMERFEPLAFLEAIERYRITHVQMVPTMFVRLLKLGDEDRRRYDLSSLQFVVHAAAPCPVEVKRRMFDWWGPIIHEYYAASEGNGFFAIGPEEWLAHPGSVGRSLLGTVHIVDGDGGELPAGEVGTVYVEGAPLFEYHNDPAKTAEAYNDRGWTTLGDMGAVDDEGYLYLSDRRSNLILRGGVNIYPQEVEDALALHPAVADVAVIGVADEEMGQEVKAVVQLTVPGEASPELGAALIAYCRDRLAGFKCPRTVDFVDELPRLPTGKLAKRLLRDRYEAPPVRPDGV